MKLQLSLLLLIISLSAPAQITTDGTVGPPQNLPGPDYQIGADLGQQHGGNLFHSFQDFNLQSHESATFSGPNHIQNVISRVTGGNPSQIDGLFRSTIPDADMYFLNPDGIIFGPNARLDVQGSFHASTADYLRLGDGGRFDARNPNDSILTVAPIESFGFLTDAPSSISIQDSTLSVLEGKTLSLIGGDLQIKGTPIPWKEGQGIEMLAKIPTILAAKSGRINLASIASAGQLRLTKTTLNFDQGTQKGQINLDYSLIDTSGNGEGRIFIHGDSVKMFTSWAFIHVTGEQSDSLVEVQANNLKVKAAGIISYTDGTGQAADITLKISNTLEMLPNLDEAFSENSSIETDSVGLGNAGNIEIEAGQLTLKGGSQIGLGLSNDEITSIKVTGTLHISGQHSQARLAVPSGIYKTTQISKSHSDQIGGLKIEANRIEILDGGQIAVHTVSSGQGGLIIVNAKELVISGILNPYKTSTGNVIALPSSISAQSLALPYYLRGEQAGDSGNILIEAEHIWLQNGGQITNTTYKEGNGGQIQVVTNELIAKGQQESAGFTFKSGIASNSLSDEANAGNAGNINVQANKIILQNHAEIATTTANAAGGHIVITTPYLIDLQKGAITTSVVNGSGAGGNITIDNPTFVVLDKGQIKAQADAGNGGNIRIVAEHFIKSYESFVSASSRLGLDGNVQIDSPTVDLSGALLVLATDFDASGELKPPCSLERVAKEKQNYSLVVKSMTGSPPSPYDWKANRLILLPVSLEKTNPAKTPLPPQKDTIRGSSALTLKAVSLSGCQPDLSKPTPPQIKTPSMRVEKSVIPDQLF